MSLVKKHRCDDANLDSYTSSLRKLEEMTAELLHSAGEELDIVDSFQAFYQGSCSVVYAHPGYYLHGEIKTICLDNAGL